MDDDTRAGGPDDPATCKDCLVVAPALSDYITLGQAASALPGRPHASRVWRWCRQGIVGRSGRRVFLQFHRVGGRIMTTPTWVRRFHADIEAADLEAPPTLTHPNRVQRPARVSHEQAERELKAQGL